MKLFAYALCVLLLAGCPPVADQIDEAIKKIDKPEKKDTPKDKKEVVPDNGKDVKPLKPGPGKLVIKKEVTPPGGMGEIAGKLKKAMKEGTSPGGKPLDKGADASPLKEKLFNAVDADDSSQLNEALEEGAHVNSRDPEGLTALMKAALVGHTGVVRALLKAPGIGVNHKFTDGYTALMMAAEEGETDIVRALLAAPGIAKDLHDINGYTALMLAAYNGRLEAVNLLIESPPADANAQSKDGYTALMLAVSKGHTDIVRALLTLPGIKKDAQDIDGYTALIWAAYYGRLEAVNLLIESPPADVNARNKDGQTALMMAASEGHTDIVQVLLGVPGIEKDDTDSDGWTALMYAAYKGQTDIVRSLIEANANVTAEDKDGGTALMYAEEVGQTAVVALLKGVFTEQLFNAVEANDVEALKQAIAGGADTEAKDSEGYTPLQFAVMQEKPEAIKALIAGGANPETVWKYGFTALSLAVQFQKTEALKAFIEAGGVTPGTVGGVLFRAVNRGPLAALEALLGNAEVLGVIDSKNRRGNTALMVALDKQVQREQSQTETVEFSRALINAGADVNLKNNAGQTALLLAAKWGNEDAVIELLKADPKPELEVKDTPHGTKALRQFVIKNKPKAVQALVNAGARFNDLQGDLYPSRPIDIAKQRKFNEIISILENAIAAEGTEDTEDTGRRGDTGDSGARGDTGRRGDTGDSGARGDTGQRGDTGDSGSRGDTGRRGDAGDSGARGDTGRRGDTGDSGARGDTGRRGDTGNGGSRGNTGRRGDSGARGDTGRRGDTGELPQEGERVATPSKLFTAVAANNVEAMKLAIAGGADIEGTDIQGHTPLMAAVRQDSPDMVKALIEEGANPDTPWKDTGHTALTLAAQHKKTEALKAFIEAGGVTSRNAGAALRIAAFRGPLESLEALLAVDLVLDSIESKNTNGETALLIAVDKSTNWKQQKKDTIEFTRALIAAGADVTAKNNRGQTALVLALGRGNNEVAKILEAALASKKLFTAVDDDDVGALNEALREGADVNGKDSEGHTALVLAAKEGSTKILQVLLAVPGIEKDARDSAGWTALMWGAYNGNGLIVQDLINAGADATVKDSKGRTALMLASSESHTGVVESLKDSFTEQLFAAIDANDLTAVKRALTNGADVNFIDTENYSWTPLHNAAWKSFTDIVKALIAKGADVDAQGDEYDTPLMLAAGNGHTETVKTLIAKGADIEAEDTSGDTALAWALGANHHATVKVIREALAPPGESETPTEKLFNAVKTKDLEALKQAIAGGADVNAKNADGYTALLIAAEEGLLDIVRALLEVPGIGIDLHDVEGVTALMFAANEGHTDIVNALLDKGADANGVDNNRKTALMYAAEGGHLAIVRALVDKGARIDRKDNDGATAVIYAYDEGHQDILDLFRARLPKGKHPGKETTRSTLFDAVAKGSVPHVLVLISAGDDVNAKDSEGLPVLHYAINAEDKAIAKILIDNGADIEATNASGETALILAVKRRSSTELMKYLVGVGANVKAVDSKGWTALVYAKRYLLDEIVELLESKGATK